MAFLTGIILKVQRSGTLLTLFPMTSQNQHPMTGESDKVARNPELIKAARIQLGAIFENCSELIRLGLILWAFSSELPGTDQ